MFKNEKAEWVEFDQFYFLIDGCLSPTPFVTNNFGRKS